MGTRDEENLTLQDQQQRTTEAPFVRAEAEQAQNDRLAADAEAQRKAAEDALVNPPPANGQNQMVAAESAAPNWPDDGYQAAPPGRFDGLKAAVGIGPAADAVFAADLLRSGQAPLGSATASANTGAMEQTGSGVSPAAKPALGLG